MNELPHNDLTVAAHFTLTSRAREAIFGLNLERVARSPPLSIKCIDEYILSHDRILEPSAA